MERIWVREASPPYSPQPQEAINELRSQIEGLTTEVRRGQRDVAAGCVAAQPILENLQVVEAYISKKRLHPT